MTAIDVTIRDLYPTLKITMLRDENIKRMLHCYVELSPVLQIDLAHIVKKGKLSPETLVKLLQVKMHQALSVVKEEIKEAEKLEAGKRVAEAIESDKVNKQED